MRLRTLGARCTKVEPPAGDPMAVYCAEAYADMHQGIRTLRIDLKQPSGHKRLLGALERTDVLLTSFRPSALRKLGLDGGTLQARFPSLSLVSIVGAPGLRAEEPGHDLTYMAEQGLVPDLSLPPTLYADMAGALTTSEAVIQAVLLQKNNHRGCCIEVALSEAARWLAMPRNWGLTASNGDVGGAHAGYGVYACHDGRVALAALEPNFWAALCEAIGMACASPHNSDARQALAAFFATRDRQWLSAWAIQHDLPLHTLV
jgi:crotonobetainyl-CoA:carnitine CoA-transferase CaiB-like acyl-CoA transferase